MVPADLVLGEDLLPHGEDLLSVSSGLGSHCVLSLEVTNPTHEDSALMTESSPRGPTS